MKKLAILALVIVALIGTAIAAAPFIAATDLAKRSIATQIEEWTGRPVTFVGEPEVNLFPYLAITIKDAKIGNAPGIGDGPFVEMDALTCKLRLLQFLIGRTEVAEFELVRPRFHLAVDSEGKRNWLMKDGTVMSEAAERDDSSATTARQIAEIKLGRFKIVDGAVAYENAVTGRKGQLQAVKVNLRWPSTTEPLSGSGTFMWRGESVEFNGSVEEPLELLGGRSSAMRVAVASAPLKLSFTGDANLFSNSQLDGSATISTPSLRGVGGWLGASIGKGSILGAGRIEGDLNWIGNTISFADASLELDGNAAEGAVSIDYSGAKPQILGTLAFEKLDLSPYAETFRATINAEGPWQLAPIRLSLLDKADIDLRVSAGQVLLGASRIGRVAGTARIEDGKLGITLGEAQLYGGSLTAHATTAMIGKQMVASANLEFDAVPAGVALADFAGLSRLDGSAAAKIAISGGGEIWGEFLGSLNGSATIEVANGAFTGIELGEFAARSGAPDVRDTAEGSGAIPFDAMSATVKLADGVLTSDDFHAEGSDFAVDLDLSASLVTASIQAKGVLMASRAGAAPGVRREIPFVIGGFWNAPLLLPDYERLIQRGVEAQQRRGPQTGAMPVNAGTNG